MTAPTLRERPEAVLEPFVAPARQLGAAIDRFLEAHCKAHTRVERAKGE